jgi:hypothetical protein
MQFNQTNNNKGDVNNAISEKGNVVQTTGSASTGDVMAAASGKGTLTQTDGEANRVQIGQPKETFWSSLWKTLIACWRWITSLF